MEATHDRKSGNSVLPHDNGPSGEEIECSMRVLTVADLWEQDVNVDHPDCIEIPEAIDERVDMR